MCLDGSRSHYAIVPAEDDSRSHSHGQVLSSTPDTAVTIKVIVRASIRLILSVLC